MILKAIQIQETSRWKIFKFKAGIWQVFGISRNNDFPDEKAANTIIDELIDLYSIYQR